MQQQPRNDQQQRPAGVEDHHDRDVAAGDADAEVAGDTVKEEEMSVEAAGLTDPAAAPAQSALPPVVALQPLPPGDAATIEFDREHPASAEEFEAVAVLAALELAADETGCALRPLWPMMLDFLADIVLPTEHHPVESLNASFIPQFVHALRSPLYRHQYGGAIGMKKVLSPDESTPIDDAIAAGAVPLLAVLLDNDNAPATQFAALWALSNIAGGTTEQATSIVNTPGAIANFVRLVGSADSNVCEQAVWALGNIAADSAARRDLLIEHGIFAKLTALLTRLDMDETLPLHLRCNATWAMSNICRVSPAPPTSAVADAIPHLVEMIQFPDVIVAANALWSLAYMSDDCNTDGISLVIASGALPAIMHHLSNGAVKRVETPALHCLVNVITGDEHQIAAAVEHGAITALCTLLRAQLPTPQSHTMAVIVSALADIAASAPQISTLLQAGVFTLIASFITSDDEHIRKGCQHAVNNALHRASRSSEFTAIVVSGCFQALLAAATTQRITPAGAEGIEMALVRGFNFVATMVSLDELSVIVDALSTDKDPNVQRHAHRIHMIIQGETPGHDAEGNEEVGAGHRHETDER
jgi:hypothetical protein